MSTGQTLRHSIHSSSGHCDVDLKYDERSRYQRYLACKSDKYSVRCKPDYFVTKLHNTRTLQGMIRFSSKPCFTKMRHRFWLWKTALEIPNIFTTTSQSVNLTTKSAATCFNNILGNEYLSLTDDPDQSLIFFVALNGQLSFNIVDIFGNSIVMASEQDVQNAGNEPVFFATNEIFLAFRHEAVIASLNDDCSLGLTLPYNGARTLQICEGTLWLLLATPPGNNCRSVVLNIEAYTDINSAISSLTSTEQPTPTSSFLV